MADFGIDVIKIEKPCGDESRDVGPFYHRQKTREASLTWWAFNANKRGMTLDISTPEGRGIFLQLVGLSDFVIESFPPRHLMRLGLSYETLAAVNPGIILTSISGFGQIGPHAGYKAPDIVCMAMGGLMNLTGEADRPPLRITVPQAYLHAGSEAAAGSLIALWHREMTGEGQWVDISAQECVAWECFHNQNFWNMAKINLVRGGDCLRYSTVYVPSIFRCKDGYVHFMLFGALATKRGRYLVEWMRAEGFDTRLLDNIDWDSFSPFTLSPEQTLDVVRSFEPFFVTKTREELFQAALARGLLLSPSNSVKEITEDIHLERRGFWQAVRHPELDGEEILLYPGAFTQAAGNPCSIRSRAPLVGEHTLNILVGDLGMSAQEVSNLQRRGVI